MYFVTIFYVTITLEGGSPNLINVMNFTVYFFLGLPLVTEFLGSLATSIKHRIQNLEVNVGPVNFDIV